ncbi:MAG TPA: fumarate hydratase [Elusimicrobia bacterium]|nr:MAG: fumarate hydratase [Elusimicrobia bacterium RIFOXYA12_FULL_49_49]OGS08333.1 MAG: fumarate hydratase [Elusimicrobia bacterium RIFOXYA1_FULL_47_7]OGS11095.1 MAG: fumarate hydratase [Elusimicrobia bacterium RIFOXYB1_FULL_48_9]OGS15810.1 MAG: fumarate hydratase [Elusimicrobia bacterium RIFOXYA2_FULL_47_53]OGS25998.1 MAG: fumarate hydratase [Elusimicrobia bacterium RIFOXYB12_FULL_50_12]OGS31142.1 MAG: fumarate hydratase [Elusimicrobia bacterium RIFOXYB2_FULL_46_23]HBU69501.1 fumarate hydra
MRQVEAKKISEAVAKLCQQANYFLPGDVWRSIEAAYQKENGSARDILGEILQNARSATKNEIALCQDTGIAEVFIKLGGGVAVTGGTLEEAVNNGVAQGYTGGYLRTSIVNDPFERKNTLNNTPVQLYIDSAPGEKIEITILPKGGGSENASALKMFTPSASWQDIKDFILELIREKGVNSCPPLVVGVGIGGSFSGVAKLAKKALLREIGSGAKNAGYEAKEKELLKDINELGIGPMGLGGRTTALAVHIEPAPCHIASLPVAVSMQCHSCRRITGII